MHACWATHACAVSQGPFSHLPQTEACNIRPLAPATRTRAENLHSGSGGHVIVGDGGCANQKCGCQKGNGWDPTYCDGVVVCASWVWSAFDCVPKDPSGACNTADPSCCGSDNSCYVQPAEGSGGNNCEWGLPGRGETGTAWVSDALFAQQRGASSPGDSAGLASRMPAWPRSHPRHCSLLPCCRRCLPVLAGLLQCIQLLSAASRVRACCRGESAADSAAGARCTRGLSRASEGGPLQLRCMHEV